MAGGGAGYVAAPDYLVDTSSMILFAKTSGNRTWQDVIEGDSPYGGYGTTTYAQNPNVLRFLIEKGITDAGGNPFEGVSSYVPDEELEEAADTFSSFRTKLDEMDPDGNWDSFFDTALTKAGTVLPTVDRDALLLAAVNRSDVKTVMQAATDAIDTGALDDAVDSFRRRSLRQHLRSLNRYASGMADVNAVHSSAFILGMSQLEGDYDIAVTDFRTRASITLIGQAISLFMSSYQRLVEDTIKEQMVRVSFGEANAQRMLAIQDALLRFEAGYVMQKVDLTKMNIITKVDEFSGNLEYDVKGAMWDMELFQMAGNVVSSSTGSVVPTAGKPSRVQSMLGGAASGAAVAAQIPGAGGWGTAAGALIGGVAGFLE